jgi:hypothetical protein
MREPEPEPSILSTPVVKYRELVEQDAPKSEEAAPTAPAAHAEPVSSPAQIYKAEKPVSPAPEPVKAEPTKVEPPRPETADATETKSIWEVFGVPRPSETGEVAAAPEPTAEPLVVEAVPEAKPAAPSAITPAAEAAKVVVAAAAPEPAPMPDKLDFPPASTRAGLRLALRRRMVSLRRP